MSRRRALALVIGIGDYQCSEQIPRLHFAGRDAAALAELLKDPDVCGFPKEQVILLLDEEAGRDAVVSRLSKWLPALAKDAEIVLIYFAGHGTIQTIGHKEQGFLLPYDANPGDVVTRGIAMNDLVNWTEGLAPAVVVCLDCCHAGKVLGRPGIALREDSRDLSLWPALLQEMSGKGRFLIASCDEGQKSIEAQELGHGLFTHHLLEGMRGAADQDGDGQVGVAELFNYVSAAVAKDSQKKFGREQKPWISAIWAEGVFISSPGIRRAGSALPAAVERLYREQGPEAAVREMERQVPTASEETLIAMLRFFARTEAGVAVPLIFRLLAHASPEVRERAAKTVHALGWIKITSVIEALAMRGDAPQMDAILTGIAAFEAHSDLVNLLDRLVLSLHGDLRNRAILLLERKRLSLDFEQVAASFREKGSSYQLQRVLGPGLFTAAYLARATLTDLDLVVRVLRPEVASQPAIRSQFMELARKSVRFVHQNLVLTRDAGAIPERNIYYAVRDYVPGITLQQALQAGKQFNLSQIAHMLRQMLGALTPLHRDGIPHGGVKPSNIFVTEDGRALLGDPSLPPQGIGLALDRLAYDYRYAAPETFQTKRSLGPGIDFYSLGCVTYELLYGQPPFVSDNYFELPMMHQQIAVRLPSEVKESCIPRVAMPHWNNFVLRLLEKVETVRFADLGQAIRAIDQLESSSQAPILQDQSLIRKAEALSLVGYVPKEKPTASGPEGSGQPASISQSSRPEITGPEARKSAPLTEPTSSAVTGLAPPQPTPDDTIEFIDSAPLSGPARSKAVQQELQIQGFEILEELGRGGMGVVYKARQIALNRLVALKMILPGSVTNAQLARFRWEAEAAARLQHPNIVQVYHVGEFDGFPFMVLEFVDGRSLNQRWDGKPQPPRETAGLVRTLALAVEHAHQQGVIHRDLKPGNVLMQRRRQQGPPEDAATWEGAQVPKISDFGLAKHWGEEDSGLTRPGEVLGTPNYMAPEQVIGARGTIGPAIDIYGLGAILYYGLAGRPPFCGVTAIDTLDQLRFHEPVRIRQLQPKVPADVETICLKCLEKDPAKRYSSAKALADDLERFLNAAPILARKVGPIRRQMRWARKNSVLVGLLLTAIALVAMIVLYFIGLH
jgi:serine/threonine protein kinase